MRYVVLVHRNYLKPRINGYYNHRTNLCSLRCKTVEVLYHPTYYLRHQSGFINLEWSVLKDLQSYLHLGLNWTSPGGLCETLQVCTNLWIWYIRQWNFIKADYSPSCFKMLQQTIIEVQLRYNNSCPMLHAP